MIDVYAECWLLQKKTRTWTRGLVLGALATVAHWKLKRTFGRLSPTLISIDVERDLFQIANVLTHIILKSVTMNSQPHFKN